jgi:4-hydroxybenzoate polyprenyltransferase
MKTASVTSPAFYYNYLKMIRVVNLVIIAITQYLTAIFLATHGDSLWSVISDKGFFLLVLSTVFIASAGYIINDYYDVKIDFVNKPKRVIVGKTLSRGWVIVGQLLLNLLAIGIGFYLSTTIGIINLIAAFLLWIYSNQLKRLPFIGNLIIGGLTGLTVLVVAQYFSERAYLILCYAVFAGFITLVREIIKDMEDLKGDERFGCKTVPIVWGIPNTKKFIYLILALFVITVFLMIWPLNQILPFTLLGVLIMLIFMINRADTVKSYGRLSTICKIIMLLGVSSMIYI